MSRMWRWNYFRLALFRGSSREHHPWYCHSWIDCDDHVTKLAIVKESQDESKQVEKRRLFVRYLQWSKQIVSLLKCKTFLINIWYNQHRYAPLKSVGLALVLLIVFLTSLGEGQHDLRFINGWWFHILNTVGWFCLILSIIVQCVTETDHFLPDDQCDLCFTVQWLFYTSNTLYTQQNNLKTS